jgi:hypothetical protein
VWTFHDAPIIESENLIGITDRRQPVGDDDGCAPDRYLLSLNAGSLLGFVVHG